MTDLPKIELQPEEPSPFAKEIQHLERKNNMRMNYLRQHGASADFTGLQLVMFVEHLRDWGVITQLQIDEFYRNFLVMQDERLEEMVTAVNEMREAQETQMLRDQLLRGVPGVGPGRRR